jgi:hypothetical protein
MQHRDATQPDHFHGYCKHHENAVEYCPLSQPTNSRRTVSLRMVSSGMLRRVALVRTDVSEELSACIIRVTRIGELGTEP